MLERLGLVLGWVGNLAAVLALVLGVFVWNMEGRPEAIYIFAVVAIVVFAFGRALRFILAGRK